MKTLKPMRLLVVGDQLSSGEVHAHVVETLNKISACGKRHVTIIHEGKGGPAAAAGNWASATKTPYEVYPGEPERCFTDGRPDVVLMFGQSELVHHAHAAGVRVVAA